MSSPIRLASLLAIAFLAVIAATSHADIMVDDFEQDNGKNNTLGEWANVYVYTNSGGDFLPDMLDNQKNGSRGGVVYYSNTVHETVRPIYYSVLDDTSPTFFDLSTNAWHIRFWIKSAAGTPAVDSIRLEGANGVTDYAQVDFSDYNGGSDTVIFDWKEISVPISNFLGDASLSFSLQHVKSFALAFTLDSSTNKTSTILLDDIQVSSTPAANPGTVATNDVIVDNFEQDNAKPNTLGEWSDFYAPADSLGVYIPDIGGEAAYAGTLGAVLVYSNAAPDSDPCFYYTVFNDEWPYMDLSQKPLHLRFWIKAKNYAPAISQVVLQGTTSNDVGRVDFADYNGGSSVVPPDWYEFSIPVADFLGDTSGGFSLANVKTMGLAFDSASSTGNETVVFIDEIQIATNAAASVDFVITNSTIVDDFEQDNGEPNTLGGWSAVYAQSPLAEGGLIPDTAGAGLYGSRGAIAYYRYNTNQWPASFFYSVIDDTWPYADLSQTNLYIRFWTKRNERDPEIDKVFLQGVDTTRLAQVDFAAYNNGSAVHADWYEVSIPATSFLADATAEFSLEHVKLFGFTFTVGSCLTNTASLYLDDIQIATEPAPPPTSGIPVTATLVLDDFEQANGAPNTLGEWSGMWTSLGHSDGALIPDFTNAQFSGVCGGILFYSNSLSELGPCTFYSPLSTNWPYYSLGETSLYLRFWIKGSEGTPAIDRVILEGINDAQYGRVDFANYNNDSTSVRKGWYEISIPVTNFLDDTADEFTLSRVSTVTFTMEAGSSTGMYSSFFVDDIQFAKEAAVDPDPDVMVTNTLMIDDFEQNNGDPNTLGEWSALHIDTDTSDTSGGFIPDFPNVQKNGARGSVIYYSNDVLETSACTFYTIVSTNWPYADMSRTNLYVRFWVKGNELTPAIDKIILQGNDKDQYGWVDFTNYNRGVHALAKDWYEISVPLTNFLADAMNDFTLSRVGLVAFTLPSDSSTNEISSFYLDDIHVSTQPAVAPDPDLFVTSLLVVDDFEQNNGEPNTLGYWSAMSFNSAQSDGGLIPDFAGAQRFGSLGGVLYYSNSATATEPCTMYSPLSTNWPYADISASGLNLKFWIKGDGGTVVVDKVVLEGSTEEQLGRVNFADYNAGSSDVGAEWKEISIPLSAFLGDVAGGFTLSRVKLIKIQLEAGSSSDDYSSCWIDHITLSSASGSVDLSITKTATPATLTSGSNIVYTITVANLGAAVAPDVVVTDSLPAVVSFAASGSSAGCTENSGVVTCPLGLLSGGASTSITVAVVVNPSAVGVITNLAETTTTSIEITLVNNSASAETTVPDTDGDGQVDFQDPDDDDDGILDTWEIQHFGGPTNATPDDDFDFDGAVNYGEFVADTDPGNSNSVFLIKGFTLLSPPTLSFTSSAARVYDVTYASNLMDGAWFNLQTNLAGNNGLLQVVDPADSPGRAYRIRVRIPE